MLVAGCMFFICKLPLMCTFYEHTAVRIGFRYCFFSSTTSGAAAGVVIILVPFTQLSAFLGDLFTKPLIIHLCRLDYLFFLQFSILSPFFLYIYQKTSPLAKFS